MSEIDEGLRKFQEGFAQVEGALRQEGNGLSAGLFDSEPQEIEARLQQMGMLNFQLTYARRIAEAAQKGFQRVGLGTGPLPIEGRAKVTRSLAAPADTTDTTTPESPSKAEITPVENTPRKAKTNKRKLLPVFGVDNLGKDASQILANKYGGIKALVAWEMLALNSDASGFLYPTRRELIDRVYPGQNKEIGYVPFYLTLRDVARKLSGEDGINPFYATEIVVEALNDAKQNPLVERLAGKSDVICEAGRRRISFEETLREAGLTTDELRKLVLVGDFKSSNKPQQSQTQTSNLEVTASAAARRGYDIQARLKTYGGLRLVLGLEAFEIAEDANGFFHPEFRQIVEVLNSFGSTDSKHFPHYLAELAKLLSGEQDPIRNVTHLVVGMVSELRENNPLIANLKGRSQDIYRIGIRQVDFNQALDLAGLTREELRKLMTQKASEAQMASNVEASSESENQTSIAIKEVDEPTPVDKPNDKQESIKSVTPPVVIEPIRSADPTPRGIDFNSLDLGTGTDIWEKK